MFEGRGNNLRCGGIGHTLPIFDGVGDLVTAKVLIPLLKEYTG